MLLCVIAAIVAISIWTIYSYNEVVNLRHEISQRRYLLETLNVENAELKNRSALYVTSENLDTLAQQFNLVKEKQPQYFSTAQWPLVSHL